MISKKNKVFFVLCFFFFCSLINLYSNNGHTGLLAGEKDIKYLTTKYFDIIYPQRCEYSAKILYENADKLYEEISLDYGFTEVFRMPVVITPSEEVFNAYFSTSAYNHIVMYDTTCIDELYGFNETFLSVFKHELTHAITINMKSPFVKNISKIIGDSFSLSFWITSTGMKEGATVSMESKNGEGRLNDNFVMHQVRQAKIENKFPDYLDIQIIGDIYPRGLCYFFNGAFAQWLQEKYGMEKYALLWYRCFNMKNLSLDGAFKKVYNVSQKELWQSFIDDLYVPDVKDTSNILSVLKEKENKIGRIPNSLTTSKEGFAYIDSSCNKVFYVSWDKLKKREKPKFLFTLTNIQKISFSLDSRFLIANYIDTKEVTSKRKIKIYDLHNNKFFNMEETGLNDGVIIQNEDKYYLACQKFYSQFSDVVLYELELENLKNGKSKIKGYKKVCLQSFEYEQIPFSFCNTRNNNFAFILKTKLNYHICEMNLQGQIVNTYSLPNEVSSIRDLSFVIDKNDKNKLSFSWVGKDTLPRIGILNLETAQYHLETENISGGKFCPIIKKSEDETQVVFISKFFRNNQLCYEIEDGFKKNKIENCPPGTPHSLVATHNTLSSEQNLGIEPKDYKNSFKYYKKGYFFPTSSLMSQSFNRTVPNYSLPLGVSYTTNNPWDSNSIGIQAAYGIETKSGAIGINYWNETKHLTNYFDFSSEFDRFGFKQLQNSINSSYNLPIKNFSFAIFNISTYNYYGRSEYTAREDFNICYVNNTSTSFTFSNVHKIGSGRFQKGGISLTPILNYQTKYDVQNSDVINVFDLGLKGQIYIPNLLPFNSKKNFVYNLPLKISFNVFSPTSYSSVSSLFGLNIGVEKVSDLIGYNAASFESELVLFDFEIQKHIPILNFLYMGDFKISAIYGGGFNYDSETKNQNWHFLQFNDYIQKIKDKDILYKDFCALDLSMGISTIFGNSNSMVWSIKIIPNFIEKTVDFGFSFYGTY